MHMSNLREISNMTFESEGWMIGFRTWTLKAYDSADNLICTVDENERHNYLKYVRFIVALSDKGYKLRKCDRERLKSGERSFLIRSYISQASRNDFIEIARVARISDNEINNFRELPQCEQECVAERIGLEYHELMDNLDRW